VLLAALHPDGSAFERVVDAHADAIDWPWVVERAGVHKVDGLLAARVDACRLTDRLPAEIEECFAKIRRAAQRKAGAAQRTLQELARNFERHGIPFLVIKGSVLAEHVYGNPAIRRFDDIDIVVRPEAMAAAEGMLRALGYQLGQIEALLAIRPAAGIESRTAERVTRRFYERFHYELPLTPTAGHDGVPVDLHWHVAPASKLTVDAAGLWERTATLVVADTRVTTFDLEATLIHLAVHATTCSLAGFKLLPLCDIAWAVTRFEKDYRGLWELAEAWGARAQLDAVLEMVQRGLDVPIPSSLRPARRTRLWLRPGFRRVASPAFLVEYRRRSDVPRLQRAWAEVLWNLAMRCVRWNVTRSLRVRLSRLQWRVLCWRGRVTAAS